MNPNGNHRRVQCVDWDESMDRRSTNHPHEQTPPHDLEREEDIRSRRREPPQRARVATPPSETVNQISNARIPTSRATFCPPNPRNTITVRPLPCPLTAEQRRQEHNEAIDRVREIYGDNAVSTAIPPLQPPSPGGQARQEVPRAQTPHRDSSVSSTASSGPRHDQEPPRPQLATMAARKSAPSTRRPDEESEEDEDEEESEDEEQEEADEGRGAGDGLIHRNILTFTEAQLLKIPTDHLDGVCGLMARRSKITLFKADKAKWELGSQTCRLAARRAQREAELEALAAEDHRIDMARREEWRQRSDALHRDRMELIDRGRANLEAQRQEEEQARQEEEANNQNRRRTAQLQAQLNAERAAAVEEDLRAHRAARAPAPVPAPAAVPVRVQGQARRPDGRFTTGHSASQATTRRPAGGSQRATRARGRPSTSTPATQSNGPATRTRSNQRASKRSASGRAKKR